MMTTFSRLTAVTGLLLSVANLATAQSAAPETVWSRGTTLNVFTGLATASPASPAALVGGAVGWELTPWFGVEGTGAWLDRAGEASAFSAAMRVNANLSRPHRVVPFLAGGIGLYRASFASMDNEVPEFYRRRTDPGAIARGATHTFTDPAFVLGGGVNVFATGRWAIRPQVDVMFVRRDSQQYVVTSGTVHVAYHFEGHPIRPRQRPSPTARD